MKRSYWLGMVEFVIEITPAFHLGFSIDAHGISLAFGPVVLGADWA